MYLPICPPAGHRIADLPDVDRPREKLLRLGHRYLTDAELLAILIGSGTPQRSALDLAYELLRSVGHDLHQLGRLERGHLTAIKGIGGAKAAGLLAALELGRRRADFIPAPRKLLDSSEAAYRLLASELGDLPHEEFHVLCLNRAGRLIGRFQLSSGGSSSTVVDAKILFAKVLTYPAVASVILAHNHPSGRPFPSVADTRITHRLYRAAFLLDLQVADHLIITARAYYSFADEGVLAPAEE